MKDKSNLFKHISSLKISPVTVKACLVVQHGLFQPLVTLLVIIIVVYSNVCFSSGTVRNYVNELKSAKTVRDFYNPEQENVNYFPVSKCGTNTLSESGCNVYFQ